MTRYVTREEVLAIHGWAIEAFGGLEGIRDEGLLESAVAQPMATFSGRDLYPSLADKAAALGFSLIHNHPFTDGNKRTAFAAMETFLRLNGLTLAGDVAEAERVILGVASSTIQRTEFVSWVASCIRPSIT